mmetsp:Transcript_68658/g.128081  ORF Transcript_68658/g.128081 Transcript_68658/m.128081 type:complete len:149 (-) Transcript_68658:114-560(-)
MGGAVVRCLDPCCNEHSQHDPELVESLSAYHSEPHIDSGKGHRQVLVDKGADDPQTAARTAADPGKAELDEGQKLIGVEDFLFQPGPGGSGAVELQWVNAEELDTAACCNKVPTLAPTSLIEAAQAAHDTDKPIWVEVSTLPHGPIGL